MFSSSVACALLSLTCALGLLASIAVTFATQGREYKVETTSHHEVGDKVGLLFGPDDIHVMHKAVVE